MDVISCCIRRVYYITQNANTDRKTSTLLKEVFISTGSFIWLKVIKLRLIDELGHAELQLCKFFMYVLLFTVILL